MKPMYGLLFCCFRLNLVPKGWFPGWYLQNALVYHPESDKQWKFKANEWLDGKSDSYLELLPIGDDEDDSEFPNVYEEMDDGIEKDATKPPNGIFKIHKPYISHRILSVL